MRLNLRKIDQLIRDAWDRGRAAGSRKVFLLLVELEGRARLLPRHRFDGCRTHREGRGSTALGPGATRDRDRSRGTVQGDPTEDGWVTWAGIPIHLQSAKGQSNQGAREAGHLFRSHHPTRKRNLFRSHHPTRNRSMATSIFASDTHPMIGVRVGIDTDGGREASLGGWVIWACLKLDAEGRPLGCHFVIVGDDGAFHFRDDEHITVANPSAVSKSFRPEPEDRT